MKLTYDRVQEFNEVFEEMIEFYGISKYTEDLPNLVLIHDSGDYAMGTFEEEVEEIVVNVAQCRTRKDVIGTMIHEYVHYLQPRNGWYVRYSKKYSYDNHPYEKQANEAALNDLDKFYRK